MDGIDTFVDSCCAAVNDVDVDGIRSISINITAACIIIVARKSNNSRVMFCFQNFTCKNGFCRTHCFALMIRCKISLFHATLK